MSRGNKNAAIRLAGNVVELSRAGRWEFHHWHTNAWNCESSGDHPGTAQFQFSCKGLNPELHEDALWHKPSAPWRPSKPDEQGTMQSRRWQIIWVHITRILNSWMNIYIPSWYFSSFGSFWCLFLLVRPKFQEILLILLPITFWDVGYGPQQSCN